MGLGDVGVMSDSMMSRSEAGQTGEIGRTPATKSLFFGLMTISTRVKTNQFDSVQNHTVIANRARYDAIGRIEREALPVFMDREGKFLNAPQVRQSCLEAVQASTPPHRALAGFGWPLL